MLDRTQAPPIKNPIEADLTLPQVERRSLMTGMPLYVFRGGSQEVFQLQLSTPCGTWIQEKPLQLLMTARLLKQGTKRHTSAEISQMIDYFGASLNVSYSADRMSISLTGLSEHMLDLVDIFSEVILEPTFPQNEFDNALARTKQGYLTNKTKSDYVASRRFGEMLFGKEHPYGSYFYEDDFDRIQLRDVHDFYENRFSLEDGNFFLTGNFDEDHLMLVEEKLNNIPKKGNKTPKWNYRPLTSKEMSENMVIKEDAMQSAVVTGRTLMHWKDRDYLPMVVLNTVLGGYFGSRLMSNIREDKGYTYGIYSRLTGYLHETSWGISTDVNRDVADDTLNQIRIELDRLMQDPIPEDELLTVKNYLFSGMMSSVDGPFKIMSRWKAYILNGVDESRFQEQIDVYRNVTAEELRVLAQKYFQDGDLLKLIVS